jgi:hypothetical protein
VIKYETFIIKTFDQLKNDNFDQVNFGQVIIFRIQHILSNDDYTKHEIKH